MTDINDTLTNAVTAIENLRQTVLTDTNTRNASVTTANTKASEASASAAAALADRQIVQSALASFRANWLGSFANDAAAEAYRVANSIALVDGLQYFNTTSDKTRQWKNTAWEDYDATAQQSQTNAALSATNAAASASSAQTARTAAETAATSAQSNKTAIDSIRADLVPVHLGRFANDGDAGTFATANGYGSTDGLRYYNTTTNKFRVRAGGTWSDEILPGVSAVAAAASATAAAGSAASAASAVADGVATTFQNVSSIATLRTIPVTNARNITLTGYYAAGDGGDGFFYPVVTASPTPADNNGTIIRAPGGYWRRFDEPEISALAFGVQANGTDQAARVSQLLSWGADVVFPSGTYTFTSTITNTFTGKQRVRGEGDVVFSINYTAVNQTLMLLSGPTEFTGIINDFNNKNCTFGYKYSPNVGHIPLSYLTFRNLRDSSAGPSDPDVGTYLIFIPTQGNTYEINQIKFINIKKVGDGVITNAKGTLSCINVARQVGVSGAYHTIGTIKNIYAETICNIDASNNIILEDTAVIYVSTVRDTGDVTDLGDGANEVYIENIYGKNFGKRYVKAQASNIYVKNAYGYSDAGDSLSVVYFSDISSLDLKLGCVAENVTAIGTINVGVALASKGAKLINCYAACLPATITDGTPTGYGVGIYADDVVVDGYTSTSRRHLGYGLTNRRVKNIKIRNFSQTYDANTGVGVQMFNGSIGCDGFEIDGFNPVLNTGYVGTPYPLDFTTYMSTLKSAARLTNTGNGTMNTPTSQSGIVVGQYTIRFTSSTAFQVIGPAGTVVGTGSTGSAFSTQVGFTITAGSTAFAVGDEFYIYNSGVSNLSIKNVKCDAFSTSTGCLLGYFTKVDNINVESIKYNNQSGATHFRLIWLDQCVNPTVKDFEVYGANITGIRLDNCTGSQFADRIINPGATAGAVYNNASSNLTVTGTDQAKISGSGATPQWQMTRFIEAAPYSLSSAPKAGGNTGGGSISSTTLTPQNNIVTGVYAVKLTSATAFDVENPSGTPIGSGTVGVAFATQVGFTVASSGAAFVAGDQFNITVTASYPTSPRTGDQLINTVRSRRVETYNGGSWRLSDGSVAT